MAPLTDADVREQLRDDQPAEGCCTPDELSECCRPAAKSECCVTTSDAAPPRTCGCNG